MEKDLLTILNDKIDGVLKKYSEMEKRVEELELEKLNLENQNNELQTEILELKESLALKDLELEEIVGKIESILG
jgi:cell division protein ZapB